LETPKYLIVIAGPTASGKSSLAMKLASNYQADIFSADSRQIYKEMNIGTAKPSQAELKMVKHHFVDSHSIIEKYNVGKYEAECIDALDQYFLKNDIALLVGGTGLYIKAILDGLDQFPDVSPEVQNKWNDLYQSKGLNFIQLQLKKHDETYFNQVDLNNPHRLIRALCIIEQSGEKFSSFLGHQRVKRNFTSINLYPNITREQVYERINQRVDKMVEAGLIEEARTLKKQQNLSALQTVGYQELFNHFDAGLTQIEAIEMIKQNSRRYAKRQETWFKKYYPSEKLDYGNLDTVMDYINSELKKSYK